MAESRGGVSERVRRALYAVSRGRCYAPECDEPVVLIDRGEAVFVGEVAHIIGAVESGPRGAAEIRDREAFENLLILCGRHHNLVDSPRTRNRYPVEVLRGWKAQHEAEFDTETRAELARLCDLPARLPELLVDVFHDATAELAATVDKLEAAGHLAHQSAQLLHAAITRVGPARPAVGDGVPGIREAFEEAYDAAGGASFLGLPSGDAYEVGPGIAQHLRGARCGHPSVICALYGRPAVVITRDLWDAMSRIGDGIAGTGAHGVGLPVGSAGGDHQYVGPAVARVSTAGGGWGPGAMVEDPDGQWIWIPDLAFDPNAGSDADIAAGSWPRLDLRLRLVARMPYSPDDHRVTAAGRRRLTATLAEPGMTAILTALTDDRTATHTQPAWRPTDDQYARNDSWGASYDCLINTSDGRPVVHGRLQYLMPHLMSSNITSIVDVQLDFDSWQNECYRPGNPATGRLSLTEIVEFFTTAWTIAFDVLPLALGDPINDGNLGGRPRVSLFIINERSQNTGDDRTFHLTDLVDLGPFGVTTRQHLSRLDVAVLGRGSLPAHDTRDVVRKALARIAENAGFDAADLVAW